MAADPFDPEYKTMYADKDRCIRELHEARAIFGDRHTTRESYTQMQKCVGLILIHCPEDIRVFAQSTFQESEMRKIYFEGLWRSRE